MRAMRWWRIAGFLVLATLMFGAVTAQRQSVFFGGGIYFVDADCYSRMTRVERVLEHPFRSIRHQDFENAPAGIETHATAPLDWLIALLAVAISPFSAQALDLAGAWISPLLGLATLAMLWLWSTRERLPFRHAMLLLIAVSPMLTQAFKLGRPDHQSLLLFLIASGLVAEATLWRRPSRAAAIAWGAAWGVALWTSLYEPLILFVLLLALRFSVLRRRAFEKPWPLAWGGLTAVTAAALLFDGWRVSVPAPEVEEYFARWSHSIGELAHLSPFSAQFAGWIGWLAPALPFLLAWRLVKTRDAQIAVWLVLLLATYALTCWQIRWGCYLALVAAMALPFALAAIRWRAATWTAFVLSLWPVASQWDALLFPSEDQQAARAEWREDYAELRALAKNLAARPPGIVLAPWWLSPPLAYWSGHPCVAGSSHESLPGIVDAVRFYFATDTAPAREIAARRDIRYVVAYEPDRVLGTAATLLDAPIPRGSLGEILYRIPSLAPSWLALVDASAFFKLYEVRDHGL
jgi:hypothetical protein